MLIRGHASLLLTLALYMVFGGYTTSDARAANAGTTDGATRKTTLESELPKINADLERDPSRADLYFTRACIYRALSKWNLAYNDYNDAIARNVPDWLDEAYEGRGLCRMYLGMYNDALKDFDYSLKLHSGLFNARKHRALLLYKMGYHKRALDEVSALLNMPAHKDNAVLLKLRAKIKIAQRDFPGAMADCDASIARSKDNFEMMAERARVLIAMNQTQKAIADLNSLTAKYPSQGEFFAVLAVAHYSQKDYKQTISNSNKAFTLGYSDEDVLAAAADSYARLGQYHHVITLASRCLELSPTNAYIYYVRGQSWIKLKRPDFAKTDIDKARALGYSPK